MPRAGLCSRWGGRVLPLLLAYIFYQLLRATKFIHSGRVIHRDQKVPPTPVY